MCHTLMKAVSLGLAAAARAKVREAGWQAGRLDGPCMHACRRLGATAMGSVMTGTIAFRSTQQWGSCPTFDLDFFFSFFFYKPLR